MRQLFPGYCIDTCGLVDLARRIYPFKTFTTLKDNVEEMIKQKMLIAPKEVIVELESGTDDLGKWARQQGLEAPIDAEQMKIVQEIMRFQPPLVDVNKLVEEADPFVIALAEVNGFKVVTSEKWSYSTKKTHVPNVCVARGVPWMTVLEFIEEQGWQL